MSHVDIFNIKSHAPLISWKENHRRKRVVKIFGERVMSVSSSCLLL